GGRILRSELDLASRERYVLLNRVADVLLRGRFEHGSGGRHVAVVGGLGGAGYRKVSNVSGLGRFRRNLREPRLGPRGRRPCQSAARTRALPAPRRRRAASRGGNPRVIWRGRRGPSRSDR